MIDPRTPVIVGVGQVSQRVDPADAREPIDLLADAVRTADADTGARASLLSRIDTVAVVDMLSWRYPDPGALLARRLGIEHPRTMTTTTGGNSPQMLVNLLLPEIASGSRDVVLIGGAECVYTRWRARRAEPKVWLGWTAPDDPPCATVVGDDRPGSSPYEMAHMALAPTQVYPLFETALRGDAGHDVEGHQRHVARMWARFAAVAAGNPHAWSRVPYGPDDIRVPSPDNRLVTFPYPKRMCANIDVDQAAAIVVASYETARAAGVPDERMVFPLAGADAHDHYFFTERWSLAHSPAIATAAKAALDAVGIGIDDVARLDLYSCFPSAVQLATDALGLEGADAGDDRPLTVTGGLAFAGGPGNSYVNHSIAAMVDACRADPGSIGMVSALGWYATKHAVGLYSTTPPTGGFVPVDPAQTQAVVDMTPCRAVAGTHDGTVTVEATAVVFDRDGTPNLGILTALTDDGRRALANTRDVDVLHAMVADAWEGRRVVLRAEGEANTLVV